jgi:hypothetical protein
MSVRLCYVDGVHLSIIFHFIRVIMPLANPTIIWR